MWRGEKVRLRAIEETDWEHFQALEQDTIDLRNADGVNPPWSTQNYREMTKERAGTEPDGDAFRLVIETLGTGEFAGFIGVGRADTTAGHFMMGVDVARDHRRKGYAREAVQLVLTYMFAERRFHRCQVEIFAFNEPSLALFRTLGFTEEGRLRKREYFAGAHHDLIVFGMLADEHWAAHPHPPLK